MTRKQKILNRKAIDVEGNNFVAAEIEVKIEGFIPYQTLR
jgi:hypothetical protein